MAAEAIALDQNVRDPVSTVLVAYAPARLKRVAGPVFDIGGDDHIPVGHLSQFSDTKASHLQLGGAFNSTVYELRGKQLDELLKPFALGRSTLATEREASEEFKVQPINKKLTQLDLSFLVGQGGCREYADRPVANICNEFTGVL